MFFIKNFLKGLRCGDVSLPLSTEALDYAVGCETTLDASHQECNVRHGLDAHVLLKFLTMCF